MEMIQGVCRMCGQIYTFDNDREMSADEADEMATARCDCKESRNMQTQKEKVEKLESVMNVILSEEDDKQQLKEIARTMQYYINNGTIQKATFKLDETRTMTLSITAKEQIRIAISKKRTRKGETA